MAMEMSLGGGVEARASSSCAVSPTKHHRSGGPPRVSANVQPYGLRPG
jgi:hypothetical protein